MADSEAEVAAKPAAQIPKADPQPELNGYPPDETAADGRDPNIHNSLPLEEYTTRNELMQFFNIKPSLWNNAESRQTIDTIYQWAKQNAETPDAVGVLRAINHAETILGSRLKGDRLNRLYQYIRIQNQRRASRS